MLNANSKMVEFENVVVVIRGEEVNLGELSSDVVCYSKETCQFIHISDNVKEMRKRVTQG